MSGVFDLLIDVPYRFKPMSIASPVTIGVIVDTSGSMYHEDIPGIPNISLSLGIAFTYMSLFVDAGYEVNGVLGFFTGAGFRDVIEEGIGRGDELIRVIRDALRGEVTRLPRFVYVFSQSEIEVLRQLVRRAERRKIELPVRTGGTLLGPVLSVVQAAANGWATVPKGALSENYSGIKPDENIVLEEVHVRTPRRIGRIDHLLVFTDGELFGNDPLILDRKKLNVRSVYMITTTERNPLREYVNCIVSSGTTVVRVDKCRDIVAMPTLLQVFRQLKTLERA